MRLIAFFIFLVMLSLIGIGVWNLYNGQRISQESVRKEGIIITDEHTRDLHTFFSERTALIIVHLENTYDGKDTLITKDQLDYNAQKGGVIIEQVGMKKDREKFVALFENQVEQYENYTKGLRENDGVLMETTKDLLAKNASAFGEVIHTISPSFQSKRGEELIMQNMALTLAIVDAHAQKDTGKKMLLMQDANLQASLFAEELAQSIAADKFL